METNCVKCGVPFKYASGGGPCNHFFPPAQPSTSPTPEAGAMFMQIVGPRLNFVEPANDGIVKVRLDDLMKYLNGITAARDEELVEKVLVMRQEGLVERRDPTEENLYYFSCSRCGGHDDCDCEGYNMALEDVISLIRSKK